MANEMLEQLKRFLDSEEGKNSISEWAKKYTREQDHKDRWVEKFKQRCESDLDGAVNALTKKYYSEEYRNREHKMNVEPREPLLWLMWDYAQDHCKKCKDKRYYNMFTSDAYYIGSYVISIMHGQGSVLAINKRLK
jgi:hypothetical protein